MKKVISVNEAKKKGNEGRWSYIIPIIKTMEEILNEFAPFGNGDDVITIISDDPIENMDIIGTDNVTEINIGWGGDCTSINRYIYLYDDGSVKLDWYDSTIQDGDIKEWECLQDAYIDACKHRIELNLYDYHKYDNCEDEMIGIQKRYLFIIKNNEIIYDGEKINTPIHLLFNADDVKECVMSSKEWSEYSSALSEYLSLKRQGLLDSYGDKYKKIIDFYESKKSMIKYKVKEES